MGCVFVAALAAAARPASAQTSMKPTRSVVLLVNRNSGMCAEIPAVGAGVGSATVQNRCLDLSRQQWRFKAIAGAYRIVNATSGMEHSAGLFVIDANGLLVDRIAPSAPPEAIAARLRRWIEGG